jgi:hypothetical protein
VEFGEWLRQEVIKAVPGAVIAIQTFGDFLGFNPHCHILVTDGCFYGNGMFRVAPSFEARDLEVIFQHRLLKMLVSLRDSIKSSIKGINTISKTMFLLARTGYCGT